MKKIENQYYWLMRGRFRSEVLLRLYINDIGLSATDIKTRLRDIDISTASYILTELTDKGLAECVTDTARDRYYAITSEGKKVIELIPDRTFVESLEYVFQKMGYETIREPLMKGYIPDIIAKDSKETILIEFKKSPITEEYINNLISMGKRLDVDRVKLVTLTCPNENIWSVAMKNNVEVWETEMLDKFDKILRPYAKK